MLPWKGSRFSAPQVGKKSCQYCADMSFSSSPFDKSICACVTYLRTKWDNIYYLFIYLNDFIFFLSKMKFSVSNILYFHSCYIYIFSEQQPLFSFLCILLKVWKTIFYYTSGRMWYYSWAKSFNTSLYKYYLRIGRWWFSGAI